MPTSEVAASTHSAVCMLWMNGSSRAVERPLATPEKMASSTSLGTAEVTIAITKAIEMTAPVFCSMVRAPAAMPRRQAGTVPIIAAVLGELNMPEPMPTSASHSVLCQYGVSTSSVVIAARPMALTSMPSAASAREPWRSAQMPASGGARAVAVGPDAGQRRGDEHAERHGRELDARGDRIVALGALEVEDEHEEQ